MTVVGAAGAGSYNPFAVLKQDLFNAIDTTGAGSITKSQLEQAVTTDGGTAQAADALYAKLDPTNTGSVNQQQFSQNLPGPPFSDQIGSQLIGLQASGWPGSAGGVDPRAQIAQSLFSQIDTGGAGSITKAQLEQAVTSAGGTTQAADALYAKLDPNNTGSVSEQQFVQTLSHSRSHHHQDFDQDDGASSNSVASSGAAGNSAVDALATLFNTASSASGVNSPSQFAQSVFSQIDTGGTGAITKTQLEQTVTSAGGSAQSADALYAQLDPNNTGSVSEQQFAQYLQAPSSSGNTAQDALLALIEAPSQNASAAQTTGATVIGASDTNSFSGNTAQDALSALLQGLGANQSGSVTAGSTQGNSAQDALQALLQRFDSQLGGASQDPLLSMFNSSGSGATSGFSPSGNTAQDALLALIQASNGNAANGTANTSQTGTLSRSDVSMAMSLYQSQTDQMLFSSMGGSASTSI